MQRTVLVENTAEKAFIVRIVQSFRAVAVGYGSKNRVTRRTSLTVDDDCAANFLVAHGDNFMAKLAENFFYRFWSPPFVEAQLKPLTQSL